MFKNALLIFIIFLFPIYVFAYSKNLIVGGESIGIKINTDGLVVVGFYKINGEYEAKNTFKIGDTILKINNKDVKSINELSKVIESEYINNEVDVLIKRNDKLINTKMKLFKSDNLLKTGLYVKDSVIGLGSLVYIDPITKIYGALGHEILLSETRSLVEVRDGNILLSNVKSITKSRNGSVGSKNASILYNDIVGTIEKNTVRGIYGKYTGDLPDKKLMEIMSFNDIELGAAQMLTVVKGNKIESFDIKITDKFKNRSDSQKAFSIEITDEDLINISGGIVQGMSGSPIIQNNKIVGAVTNVVIDDVIKGYGISIITMLEEGEN